MDKCKLTSMGYLFFFILIVFFSSGCFYGCGEIFDMGERECWRKIPFEKSQFSPTSEMDKVSGEYILSNDGCAKNAQTRGEIIYGTGVNKKLTDEGKVKFELERSRLSMDRAVEFSFAGEKCIFLMNRKSGYARIYAGEKYKAMVVRDLNPAFRKKDRLIEAALIPLKHNDMVFLAIVINNWWSSQLYSVYVLDDHFDIVYKDIVSGDVVYGVGALKDGGFYVEGALSKKGTAYRFK